MLTVGTPQVVSRSDLAAELEGQRGFGINCLVQADVEVRCVAFDDIASILDIQLGHVSARTLGVDDGGVAGVGDARSARAAGRVPVSVASSVSFSRAFEDGGRRVER